MRIEYYPETDSLYVYLSEEKSADTRVLADGIQADFDSFGNLVGVEIEHVEFYASPVTLKNALSNLTTGVGERERESVRVAFDQILSGNHKQLDPIT